MQLQLRAQGNIPCFGIILTWNIGVLYGKIIQGGGSVKRVLISKILLLMIAFIIAVAGCAPVEESGNEYQDELPLGWERVRIDRVIDGDTVVLSDGRRVRLIGINAPEFGENEEPYAREASDWLKAKIENKIVYLQKDVSEVDRYLRLLRYVWMEVPGAIHEESIRTWMVNAIMTAEGYVQPYTFPPDVLYADLFLKLAREARAEEKGLWGVDPGGTTRGTPLD
jgi:micrococcal nuclease